MIPRRRSSCFRWKDGSPSALQILGREESGGVSADEMAVMRREVIDEFGLRARLEVISFVTGQQRVQLDFEPDTPIDLHGDGLPGLWEIPTLPSRTQELEQFVQQLPIGEIVADLRTVLQNLNDVLGPSDEKGRKNLRDVLIAATGALGQVEKNLPRVTATLDGTAAVAKQTLASGKLTLDQVRVTAASAEKRVNTVADAIDRLAESGDKTLGKGRNTLQNIENLTAENSPCNVRAHHCDQGTRRSGAIDTAACDRAGETARRADPRPARRGGEAVSTSRLRPPVVHSVSRGARGVRVCQPRPRHAAAGADVCSRRDGSRERARPIGHCGRRRSGEYSKLSRSQRDGLARGRQ